MQEQANLRSVIVDGQWTQRRNHRAARTLSPLCALCGSEEGSLVHRHFRCSEVPDVEQCKSPAPSHFGGPMREKVEAQVFRIASAVARGHQENSALRNPLRGDRSQTPVADTSASQPVCLRNTAILHPRCGWCRTFALFMFLRIERQRRTSRTALSLSTALKQRRRKATEASASAWADLWRDVWLEIDGWERREERREERRWAMTFLCARSKRTPLLMRCGLVSFISADDQTGSDLFDAECTLVVLEYRAPPIIGAAKHSANLAVTCMAHWIARVGSATQRLDSDATWIAGRGRANAKRHERARSWHFPLLVLPTIQRRGRNSVESISGRACTLCQHTTRGKCPGASGARRLCGAQNR